MLRLLAALNLREIIGSSFVCSLLLLRLVRQLVLVHRWEPFLVPFTETSSLNATACSHNRRLTTGVQTLGRIQLFDFLVKANHHVGVYTHRTTLAIESAAAVIFIF